MRKSLVLLLASLTLALGLCPAFAFADDAQAGEEVLPPVGTVTVNFQVNGNGVAAFQSQDLNVWQEDGSYYAYLDEDDLPDITYDEEAYSWNG